MRIWEIAQAGDFDSHRAALEAAPDLLNTPSPDGMVAALEKYLELDPNCANAAAAQGLLCTVTTSVETTYVNPDARKTPAKKKKK